MKIGGLMVMTGILGVLGGYLATQSDEPRPIPTGDEGARSRSHASPRAPLTGTPTSHKSAKSSRTPSPMESVRAYERRIVDEIESLIGDSDSLVIAEITRTEDTPQNEGGSNWVIRAYGDKDGATVMNSLIRANQMEKMLDALHQKTGDSTFSSSNRPRIVFTSFRRTPRRDESAVNRKDFPNEMRATFRMGAVNIGADSRE